MGLIVYLVGKGQSDLGIYYYGARWYDPSIMMFTSPDTLVPDPYNPLDWNRYAYARNNPINYNDPDGHVALFVTAAIGAGIGAGVDYIFQVAGNIAEDGWSGDAFTNVDGAEIVGAAVAGGIAGGTLGLGTAALAFVGGQAATTSLIAVPVAALAGGVGNAVGGQAGALAEAGVRQFGASQFDGDKFCSDAFEAGFLNSDDFIWDLGSGAILGAGGQAFANLSTPSRAANYRSYKQYKDLNGDIFRVPRNTPARLPGEPDMPVFRGATVGVMRKTSDMTQEFISQGLDRYRMRER